MSTENNNQAAPVAPEATGGEGEATPAEIKLSKAEYDELVNSKALVGSLKRELKDLKKPKESAEETPKQTDNSDELSALQKRLDKQALKAANITHEDDIELARKTAQKWGMDVDEVVEDEDFQAKLKKQQASRANIDATSNVKGDKGKIGAKDTSAYWIAQGNPPTRDQVPDRKVRAKIIREMMASEKSSKQFYND